MAFDKMQKNGEISLADAYGALEAAMINPMEAHVIVNHLYGDKIKKLKEIQQVKLSKVDIVKEQMFIYQQLERCKKNNNATPEKIEQINNKQKEIIEALNQLNNQ